jgi:hypothetical protein
VDAAKPSRGPLIAVSGDGQVTLRVEQRPLDWVQEQNALQSGRADLRAVAGVASPPDRGVSPVPASDRAEGAAVEAEACAAAIPPADAGQLLKTIEQGTDDERIPALQRARSERHAGARARAALAAGDGSVGSRAAGGAGQLARVSAAIPGRAGRIGSGAAGAERGRAGRGRQRLGDLDETARLGRARRAGQSLARSLA